jgi:SulP family sulfate permease
MNHILQRIQAWVQDALYITQWLPTYNASRLGADAVAGLTVGVMLIPQAMAYAVIAGMPPIYGLYAGLIPLVAYPLFGSSKQLALGPVAIDMIIVAAGVGAIAEPGTSRYVTLAIVLTFLLGLMQVAMGAMKLGFVANLLSRPVITGLTSAAALIIGFSQLGNLLGVDLGGSQYVHVLLWRAAQHVGEVHLLSLGIGAAGILVLVLLPKWQPLIPEALVVVVAATAAVYGFGLESEGVEVIGDIPEGLPTPSVPEVRLQDLKTLLPAALTLALVQFMKDVSLGRIFAKRHSYTINPNRELVGVGAGNLIGSFFSAIPSSGSFSRSAVNDQSGATSPLANWFTAGVIALTLLFFTPLFYYLPIPILASIIMVSGFGLIDLDEVREIWRTRRQDGAISIFTAVCVLFIGIQEGILLGVGASLIAVVYRISRPNVAELGHVPGTRLYRDLDRFEAAERIDQMIILRVDAAFSFANAKFFRDFITESSTEEGESREVRVVVIDGTSINDLDSTAVEALEMTVRQLKKEGIELHFTGLIGPVREIFRRSDLYYLLGESNFHMEPHDAVTQILERWDQEDDGSRLDRYFADTAPQKKPSTPTAS